MKQFILHTGMPKTGTTSIQQALYHNAADPAFHYITESDLFDFEPETLAWLADAAHSKPVSAAKGEAVGRLPPA